MTVRIYLNTIAYSEIGARIGKDKSTISQEIKRNGEIHKSFHKHKARYKYTATKAHIKATKRVNKGKINPNLQQFRIYLGEQIKLKQTFNDFVYQIKRDLTYQFAKVPCLKTIYNWHHQKKISF